eukprot:CAMPEP_0197482784 /NCGR_PEP_ID=MMETSP1309-20131121/56537_1 /TAXON_ID=464262 /ORGANISM="Genus nov. species nov., Strain RCC998" /LENGTH=203 /DNA_ID=CAMNT_0043025339 /DNA_START=369 /DNA_END=980 /DNA_ORIENTATION=+
MSETIKNLIVADLSARFGRLSTCKRRTRERETNKKREQASANMDEDEVTKVTLKSSDDETFEVEQEVANMSETIKNLIEDAAADNDVIPLPNVSGKDLGKVIEYCKFKVSSKKKNSDGVLMSEDEVKNWETEFVKVDQGTLFQLILAANYLNIKDLLDLTCFTVASMIRGKSPEEIRKAFNIKNDFTPEEEEEVRREHQWAFD